MDYERKWRMIDIGLILGMFLMLLYIGMYVSTFFHESAHQQVCAISGGTPVTIYTNFGLEGLTRCYDLPAVNANDHNIMQMKAEIEGYHWISFTQNMWMVGFLIVIALYVVLTNIGDAIKEIGER